MARNLANAVSNARPTRAASGVGNARAAAPRAGNKGLGAPQPQAPHPTPAQVQTKQTTQQAVAQGGSTMPWDAQAQQEAGSAYTEEASSLNQLGADWAGREISYGFGANGADNPYSQAALLATHHEWNERGRSNSSGLQAFAGSNVNAEREEVGRYTTSYGQLLQAYEAEKASKDAKEEAARNAYTQSLQNAQLGAIGRAGESEPEPVASSSGGGGGSDTPNQQGGGKKKKTRSGSTIGIGGARKA